MPLELGGSLTRAPVFLGEVPQIDVDCLGNEGTGGDGAVARSKAFVLGMSLVKDHSMDFVHLLYAGQLNALEDGIDKELKVSNGRATTVEIM